MRTLDGAPADIRRVGERWQTHLPSGSQIHMILVEHPDELPRIDAETGFQLAVGQPGGLRAVQEAHHRLEPFPGAVECGVDAARLAHPRPPARRAATASSSAVSYTHLRAHETPEHLVCRL